MLVVEESGGGEEGDRKEMAAPTRAEQDVKVELIIEREDIH